MRKVGERPPDSLIDGIGRHARAVMTLPRDSVRWMDNARMLRNELRRQERYRKGTGQKAAPALTGRSG